MNDKEVSDFLMGFRKKYTEREVFELYLQNKIDKEEFLKRMRIIKNDIKRV